MGLEKIMGFGKKILGTSLLAASLSFPVGCSVEDSQKARPIQQAEGLEGSKAVQQPAKEVVESERHEPKVSEEQVDMRRYFPLAVGNRWTYKREVANGKTPLYRFEGSVKEDFLEGTPFWHSLAGKCFVQYGLEDSISSRNETYEIVSKEGNNFRVKGHAYNEKGEKGLAEGYEPYVLHKLEELVWRVNEWSDGTWVFYETKKGIIRDMRVTCSELVGFFDTGELLINIDTDDPSKIKKYHKKVIGEYSDVIEVPAGTFKKTIKNIFEFVGGAKDETVKIVRFFAKDVGLIKEVQYDSRGEIVYKLELITCEIK